MDTIIQDPNPLLRVKSEPVKVPLSKQDKSLVLAMRKYVKDSRNQELAEKYNLRPAVGIAAPQVGINKQLFVVSVDEEIGDDIQLVEYVLANPKIIAHSVQKTMLANGEACLSIQKEYQGYVPRHARITLKAYDCIKEEEVIIKAKGYMAIVIQHELDHLHGVLFYDHINKQNPWQPIENAIIIE